MALGVSKNNKDIESGGVWSTFKYWTYNTRLISLSIYFYVFYTCFSYKYPIPAAKKVLPHVPNTITSSYERSFFFI